MGVERIRFISPHPQEVKREFIELYKDVPQLCPHIHLPLQSGSDRMLRLMNRNYRRERYLDIVERLRAVRPGIAITTGFHCGFPDRDRRGLSGKLRDGQASKVYQCILLSILAPPNTKAFVDYSKEDEVEEKVAHRSLLELQAAQGTYRGDS